MPLIRLLLLAATCVAASPAADAAAQGCGYAHREPRAARIGAAPLAIGDSVMLGAARSLSRAGFEVDARCARNPDEGLSLLRQRRRRGTLPEVVVMALGTNIQMQRGDIDRMLRAVGWRRTLVLVTPFRSWRPYHTGPMRRAARQRPKRVRLVDWGRRANRNQHWLWGDGTHLRPSGVDAYTRLIKRRVWSRQRGHFGR
ncbi:MAG TPA: hypothetical protein VD790_02325 [Thermoleophilaceae bacterium]|nr:hypothetical protein [Thermoleophilaceae bacterium]